MVGHEPAERDESAEAEAPASREEEAGEKRKAPRLQREYPELYGVLVQANSRVDSEGCIWGPAVGLVAVVVAFLLNRGVGFEYFAGEVNMLGYAFAATLGGWLGALAARFISRQAYLEGRARLVQQIRDSGISFHRLVAEAAGDDEVDDVLGHLCRDRALDEELR